MPVSLSVYCLTCFLDLFQVAHASNFRREHTTELCKIRGQNQCKIRGQNQCKIKDNSIFIGLASVDFKSVLCGSIRKAHHCMEVKKMSIHLLGLFC